MPADGAEWAIVRAAQNFTQAYHAFRLLIGGLRGVQGNGSRLVRITHPHRCKVCRSPDVAWVWSTPREDMEGVAWCRDCILDRVWALGLIAGVAADGGVITQANISSQVPVPPSRLILGQQRLDKRTQNVNHHCTEQPAHTRRKLQRS